MSDLMIRVQQMVCVDIIEEFNKVTGALVKEASLKFHLEESILVNSSEARR